MTQVKSIASIIAALLATAATCTPQAAAAAETATAGPDTGDFATALSGGAAHLEFRYRLEDVSQDGIDEDALASTLRTRLNYQTGSWRHLAAFVEADNVTVLGDDRAYNSTVNGVTDRPIVADPEYTEVNQAYLQLRFGAVTGVAGRQRITLDNQRFIGNVGWRQNEQTYDAVVLDSAVSPRLRLFYAYLDNVNRVTGPDQGSQPADYRSASHLFNGKADLGTFGSLTMFVYLLDLRNAPGLSSSSYGAHYTGQRTVADRATLNWIASVARQQDYADNPNHYAADYYLVEGGATFGQYGLKAGYEVLGGDRKPGRAFQTPLATLHAFQGWADKFLTTPAGGIEDLYVAGSATFKGLALQLAWHDFQSEATGDRYGGEWDASAGYKFGGRYEALLKFADYRADRYATDTTKTWLQFSATF